MMQYLLVFLLCVLSILILLYVKNSVLEGFSNDKILVLYVFHEYNDRVKAFIRDNIFEDENIDFLIISNDKNIKFSVPDFKNVSVIKRYNVGYDFGGWSEGLLKNEKYRNYDYFMFINSSVQGPYLNSKNQKDYINKYVNMLNNEVKLVGSTINTCGGGKDCAHVQSYAFATDRDGLQCLIDNNLFSLTNVSTTFTDAIAFKEIRMSRLIIENGWNIGCLHKLYNGIDFRKPIVDENAKKYHDIMFKEHEKKLWDRYELVFIKGNRDIQ
tara:strand:- start:5364 stop:6170 length:807 start_codon:yes stop_codon:yes gene_type:complete